MKGAVPPVLAVPHASGADTITSMAARREAGGGRHAISNNRQEVLRTGLLRIIPFQLPEIGGDSGADDLGAGAARLAVAQADAGVHFERAVGAQAWR